MRKLILVVLLFIVADLALGQSFYRNRRTRNLILSAGTGGAFYFGDLAADGDYSFVRPNLAIGARWNFYDRYSVEAQATWFMLTGDDSKDPGKAIRNLSFQSHNFELNLVGHISLYSEAYQFYARPMFNPYVYGGIGLLNFNPTAKLEGERYNLREYETEPGKSYGLFTVSFPVGLGVKYRATPFLNINLDGGFRFVMTDYLDDVSSGEYHDDPQNLDEITRKLSDRSFEIGVNPTLSERGTDVRGNPGANDAYMMINIKVEYFFNNINFGNRYGPKPGRYRAPRQRRRR